MVAVPLSVSYLVNRLQFHCTPSKKYFYTYNHTHTHTHTHTEFINSLCIL